MTQVVLALQLQYLWDIRSIHCYLLWAYFIWDLCYIPRGKFPIKHISLIGLIILDLNLHARFARPVLRRYQGTHPSYFLTSLTYIGGWSILAIKQQTSVWISWRTPSLSTAATPSWTAQRPVLRFIILSSEVLNLPIVTLSTLILFGVIYRPLTAQVYYRLHQLSLL